MTDETQTLQATQPAMVPTLQTERLLLRPLALDDVDAYHAVYGDARTWEHLPSGRHTSRDESERAIQASIDSRRVHGFAHCAVLLREPLGELPAGVFLGSAGAKMLDFEAWNLGYRFAPEAWGRGFATEAAAVALATAQQTRPATPVTARVLGNNVGSIRVLERIGLELQWRGRSAHRDGGADAHPSTPGGTTHLERVIYADRRLDDDTLDAVIALG
ncbi:RimJ/RimL family protein N-acetyltransferase [Agromyces cerinus]|uniref:GNAT family N-acetyltransferase n=1 Tax=Agromyces cerinus TaxID=33878 RepID=UPI0019579A4F|nr:GNAT family N-acetyltransferase [Agromyces cerinus]MBM7831351.1 RimJ/RimL family protein N-acetyltransferase [Agromyces cerinus]